MKHRSLFVGFNALWACLGIGACLGCGGGDDDAEESSDSADVFIAFAPDFEGYTNWTRFELGQSPADSVHPAGERNVYVNEVPKSGLKTFPVGTLIVKTVENEDADAEPSKVFAMAKRGADYNKNGAKGWEWFELKRSSSDALAILWRGIVPPSGEVYAGIVGGACNGCHAQSKANDFVSSEALDLSKL